MTKNFLAAEPSKEFFIDMLTRDIKLSDAIIDLIDNSVDAARSVYKSKKKNIEISISRESLMIKDDCGGFGIKSAKEHVFKFGRPQDIIKDEYNIGRFGVGMKRAILKMGEGFVVESKDITDHFIVKDDVPDWKSRTYNYNNKVLPLWEFPYYLNKSFNIIDYTPQLKTSGVYIYVDKIYKEIQNEFENIVFINRLIEEIEQIHAYNIERYVDIQVNNRQLRPKFIDFLHSEITKPSLKEVIRNEVNIKIFCGIGPPSPNDAGWYIYCNDRLMVMKDRSNTTGWEGKKTKLSDDGVQKFHNKVAMFRGAVFFTSKKVENLPMTTTKNSVDVNHSIYKSTRRIMIEEMKRVLSELKKINKASYRSEIVKKSETTDVKKLVYNDSKEFIFNYKCTISNTSEYTKINYKALSSEVEIVKRNLNLKTNSAVGEATFKYYLELEELL